MASLLSMYDFTKVENDKDGMAMASKLDKVISEAGEKLTTWTHSMAVKYNNPSKPMMAANAFTKHMEELAAWITSEDAGEDQWTKKNGHSSDFSLTGNSKVANAYKRTLNAMKLGGDLVGCDSPHDGGDELTTVSKCTKFATVRKAEVEKVNEQAQAIAELHQTIEEETGHKQGTPEHEEEFQKRSLSLVPETTPVAEVPAGDIYDEYGKRFAANLRKCRELGEAEAVLEDMAEAGINKLGATVAKLLERFNKEADVA